MSGSRFKPLSGEIADQTTKRNDYELRRLRQQLDTMETERVKQMRRIESNQIDYALQNLSLDQAQGFSDLTKKILRANFLPPVRQTRSAGNEDPDSTSRVQFMSELAERLRETSIIAKSAHSEAFEQALKRKAEKDRMLLNGDSESSKRQTRTGQLGSKSSGAFTQLGKTTKKTMPAYSRYSYNISANNATKKGDAISNRQGSCSSDDVEFEGGQKSISDVITLKLLSREAARKRRMEGNVQRKQNNKDKAYSSAFANCVHITVANESNSEETSVGSLE
ncbi:uncharacterized protein LOC5518331 [Nematostella vectensis]|uniref:uncharacterized protein LOC5518331 n=1 Tax=Nematostella vectensis TaxID=45351 RepID=UPI0020777975|nr:uncharacterized protein LOC5518331 [Nematostella vectensis]